jgi:hypothetical protein
VIPPVVNPAGKTYVLINMSLPQLTTCVAAERVQWEPLESRSKGISAQLNMEAKDLTRDRIASRKIFP